MNEYQPGMMPTCTSRRSKSGQRLAMLINVPKGLPRNPKILDQLSTAEPTRRDLLREQLRARTA